MPATATRTDRHPERGLPDRAWDYKRSHLRARITRRGLSAYSLKGGATYRRSIGGWTRLHPVRVPDRLDTNAGHDTRWELSEHVEALNQVCARLYQADLQQKAQREADRLNRRRRVEAARQEYEEWLDTLPFGADAYKEDPDRWVYPGQDDRGHAREMSTERWLHRKAHKHYPDEAKNVAAEIRGKYDLHRAVRLV